MKLESQLVSPLASTPETSTSRLDLLIGSNIDIAISPETCAETGPSYEILGSTVETPNLCHTTARTQQTSYISNDERETILSEQALHSPLFIKENPLPIEILEMSQEETACKYCGISYLLLTKYEKMSKELLKIQEELTKNRKITLERPLLLERIAVLSKLQQESSEKVEELEEKVEEFKSKTLKDSKFLENMQEENIDVKNQLFQVKMKFKGKMQELKREKQRNSSILKENFKGFKETLSGLVNETRKEKEAFMQLISLQKQEIIRLGGEALGKTILQVKKNLEEKYESNKNILKSQISDLQSEIEEYKNGMEKGTIHLHALENQILNENVRHKLELDKLNSGNLELHQKTLSLEKELQNFQERIGTEQEKYAVLETRFDQVNRKLQLQENNLSEKLKEKDEEILQLQQEIMTDRKASEAVQSLATQAGVGLAKKDEKISSLEKNLKDLKEQLQKMILEREKTVEAHQSRIKQLQDTFLEKLKDAGREEAEKANEKTKRIMNAEKEAAIAEWTKQLQEEFDTKENALREQNSALKKTQEDFKRQMARREEDWKRKCDMLIEQNKKAQASNSADFEHYQTRIRSLEAEIIKNQAAPAAEGPPPNLKEIADLNAIIEKRNAEIVFLKDTVRLECEERISLIAKLAVVTQNGTIPIQESPKIPKSISCTLPTAPVPKNVETSSRESCTSVSGRKTFETMMHEAALKKEKKLAKSSSRKKLYGI